MNNRRELRRLVLLFEIMETKSPRYLFDTIAKQQFRQNSRLYEKNDLLNIPSKGPYRLSFFPSTILDWNKLDKWDPGIKQAKSINIFKKRLLNKIRPKKRSFFGLSNDGVRYLTMLRMELSPLRAHKFRFGFSDTSDPFCDFCLKTKKLKSKENTEH